MKDILEPSEMSEFKMLIKDLLEEMFNDANTDPIAIRLDKTISYVNVHPELKHSYLNGSGSCLMEIKSGQPIPFYEEKLFEKIIRDLNERIKYIGGISEDIALNHEINKEHISFLKKNENFLKDFIYAYETSLNNHCNEETIEWNKQSIITLLKQMIQEIEKPFVDLEHIKE